MNACCLSFKSRIFCFLGNFWNDWMICLLMWILPTITDSFVYFLNELFEGSRYSWSRKLPLSFLLCFSSVFITTVPELPWQPSCRSRLAALQHSIELFDSVWPTGPRAPPILSRVHTSHSRHPFFSLAVCFAKYSSSHSPLSFLYQSCSLSSFFESSTPHSTGSLVSCYKTRGFDLHEVLAYASLHLRSWVCAFVCKAHANADWSLQSDWRWQFRGDIVWTSTPREERIWRRGPLHPCFALNFHRRNGRNKTSICEYWSSHKQQCQGPVCPTLALNVRRKEKILFLCISEDVTCSVFFTYWRFFATSGFRLFIVQFYWCRVCYWRRPSILTFLNLSLLVSASSLLRSCSFYILCPCFRFPSHLLCRSCSDQIAAWAWEEEPWCSQDQN